MILGGDTWPSGGPFQWPYWQGYYRWVVGAGMQQLPSLHEDTCPAEISHLQLVGTFHVLTPSSILFLPPWKEKSLSKDATWACMWSRENPFCSKQNFKLAQCVLLSLLCCLIKEIMKLEIREKRKKDYLDLFVFPCKYCVLGLTKLCFSCLMWHWLQQKLLVPCVFCPACHPY